jgi:hypothetical protein
MERLLASICLPVALLILVGCGAADETRRSAERGPITHEQIVEASLTSATAYEVVSILRPAWLRARGVKHPSTTGARTGGEVDWSRLEQDIPIYLDHNRVGDTLNSLRDLSASRIATIERLSGGEAQARLGSGHPSGAIMITSR